jgi:hypothetical protein
MGEEQDDAQEIEDTQKDGVDWGIEHVFDFPHHAIYSQNLNWMNGKSRIRLRLEWQLKLN